MKTRERGRQILHIDLHPFFVSVERSLDPELRDRPVIIGGGPDGTGFVAAASSEAQAAGVRVGQPVGFARRRCPEAAVLPGDLERYAAVSQEVTDLLLTASRRVERPSADEAYLDLTRETAGAPSAAATAERLKDELRRRFALEPSFGVASCRLAARVASAFARPKGLLILLAGYETSFLSRASLSFLEDLPTHVEGALERAGITTLGALAQANAAELAALVGVSTASRLQATARGEDDAPVEVAAPPAWIQEEATVRSARGDRESLLQLAEALGRRASRRLRPFGLQAGQLTVEVVRQDQPSRREHALGFRGSDEDPLATLVRSLALPLLTPPAGVRAIQVRLTRLGPPPAQAPLFPLSPGAAR